MSKFHGAITLATPELMVVRSKSAPKKEALMSRLMKSAAMYWIVVIGAGVILLWAWAIAIEKILQGKTVILG
jgi:hypothetical protein